MKSTERERDPLLMFLYILLRDHLPSGKVEEIMEQHVEKMPETQWIVFSNPHIVAHAEDIIERFNLHGGLRVMIYPSKHFTDVVRNGAFVTSIQAQDGMRRLAHQWKLGFIQTPGGGEFNGDIFGGFRCRITMCDDVADYEKLSTAIVESIKRQGTR